MSRRRFTSVVVPAMVMASVLMAEPAGAIFPPGPPPGPPPMRMPGPPPMRMPGPPAMRMPGPPAMHTPRPRAMQPPAAPPLRAPTPRAPRLAGPRTPARPAPRPSGAPAIPRQGGPKALVDRTSPAARHAFARPGANPGASAAFNGGNVFANRPVNIRGDVSRGVNDFAGGWSGLSEARDDLRGLYDREYARDILNGWAGRSGWSGGGGGSDGYGSYGSGYSNPYSTSDSGYSNSYSTADSGYSDSYSAEAEQGNVLTANAESQQQEFSESSTEFSTKDAANFDNETKAAKQYMYKAVSAFQKGDYAGAKSQCDEAIRLVPRNANMHEFRALCQFAQGKHKAAAATLYSVLAGGPGWDWQILSSFYRSAETYTTQLRALEEYVEGHPKDAGGYFVLAYHYLVLDERDAAINQLREVVKLQPRDPVSAAILKTLEKTKKGENQAATEKPAPGR